MTKLRKLTALLLAGALTLLLLTACSGGGGSSGPEAQAEAEVMRGHPKQRRHRSSGHMTLICRNCQRQLAKTNLDAELKAALEDTGSTTK